MVEELHLLPRGRIINHARRAESLAHERYRGPERAGRVRVVELFTPTLDCDCADLSTDSWNMPEVITAIHAAAQVHVHSLDVDLTLSMLPFVRPSVLENTLLVIHGPCARRGRLGERDATRLQAWPGPVAFDPWAERRLDRWVDGELKAQTDLAEAGAAAQKQAADLLGSGHKASLPLYQGSAQRFGHRLWVDPSDAELLPSACGAGPISVIDAEGQPQGDAIVMISVSAAVSRALVAELPQALAAAWPVSVGAGLAFELVDEAACARPRAQRRVAQLCLCADMEDAALYESACQGVPVVCLADLKPPKPELIPPGTVECNGAGSLETVEQAEAESDEAFALRSAAVSRRAEISQFSGLLADFAVRWRQGLPAYEGLEEARAWALERCHDA